MLDLKQFTLVAVLKLLESLWQVLGPIYDRLCITNFDLRKGSFSVFLQQRIATSVSSPGQKSSIK